MRALLAASVAVALLGTSSSALAYCRTKACDNRPSYEDVWQDMPDPPCTRDRFGCPLEGTPLMWPASCISYTVQKDGSVSDGISFETANAVIDQAFATWKAANCGGQLPSIEVLNLGAVSCNRAEYNQEQPNANIFTFRDGSWPYKNAQDTLALTTITYNTENAEVYDADVEINTFDNLFTTTDVTEHKDLLAVLTHEVGHFLGLSHADRVGITMFPTYMDKDTHQRTLDVDDMNGICEIYPPGRAVDADNCAPRHGFSSACAAPEEDEGCSMARGRNRSLAGLALFLPVVVAFRLRRRKR